MRFCFLLPEYRRITLVLCGILFLGSQRLALSANLLNVAAGPKTKTITIVGDGGKYDLTLVVTKG